MGFEPHFTAARAWPVYFGPTRNIASRVDVGVLRMAAGTTNEHVACSTICLLAMPAYAALTPKGHRRKRTGTRGTFQFPLKGVFILDNSREAGEHRHMIVYVWAHWLGRRIFKAKKKACEAAVREVIGPLGKVTVDLVPKEALEHAHAQARSEI